MSARFLGYNHTLHHSNIIILPRTTPLLLFSDCLQFLFANLLSLWTLIPLLPSFIYFTSHHLFVALPSQYYVSPLSSFHIHKFCLQHLDALLLKVYTTRTLLSCSYSLYWGFELYNFCSMQDMQAVCQKKLHTSKPQVTASIFESLYKHNAAKTFNLKSWVDYGAKMIL